MAAQYLYNVYTQTILFSTILGRVSDAVPQTSQRSHRPSLTACRGAGLVGLKTSNFCVTLIKITTAYIHRDTRGWNRDALSGMHFVIGHGIGGKYIPIMARLAEARHWSKRRQTCLPSPDLTAIHNEWWLEDPSTFTQRTTERSYGILRRVSYES